MVRVAVLAGFGVGLFLLGACARPPGEAAARRVRTHAAVLAREADALRACLGDTLPADPVHAPVLGPRVCECAAPVVQHTEFGACGRGANFLAFADSSGWAALVFAPAGPPAIWPHGQEQIPFGRGVLYATGVESLGGPWYLLYLNPTVD